MSENLQPEFVTRITEVSQEQFRDSPANLRDREKLYFYANPRLFSEAEEREIQSAGIIPIEKKMLDQLDLTGHEDIADIGCGDGSMLMYIYESVYKKIPGQSGHLLGVDPNPVLYRDQRDKLGNNVTPVEFLQGEAENLPIRDNRLDVLFASFILYHVEDREKALDEFRRVVKPGGKIVIATRSERNLGSLWHHGQLVAKHLSKKRRYGHIEVPHSFYPPFDLETAERVLPQKGFEINQRFVQNSALAIPKEGWDDYRRALLTLRTSFEPTPRRTHMNRAINKVIRPLFDEQEATYNYFIDCWVRQGYFICTNHKPINANEDDVAVRGIAQTTQR